MKTAPGGLPIKHCYGKAEALRSESEVVVRSWKFPECFTRDPRTWARHHGATYTIETGRPLKLQKHTTGWWLVQGGCASAKTHQYHAFDPGILVFGGRRTRHEYSVA